MRNFIIWICVVFVTSGEVSANSLLSHDGRWTLVSHRVDLGKSKGIETRIGWEPKSLTEQAKQRRDGYKNDSRFGGRAILTDSLSVLTFHFGIDTEIYVFRGEIKPGTTTITFVMGTGWEPGDRFKAIVNLKKDAPYNPILLPDDTEEEMQDRRERRKNKMMVAIYDLMELELISLEPGYEDRVERFRFRRITN